MLHGCENEVFGEGGMEDLKVGHVVLMADIVDESDGSEELSTPLGSELGLLGIHFALVPRWLTH